MSETRRFSLVKPTLETPFHIDFDWWKNHESDWRVFMYSYLCPDHHSSFAGSEGEVWVDWVDPETAEIRAVDGLQQVLMSHCAQQPGFVNSFTTLVDAVFRVLLSNGNQPLTPRELGEAINRQPDTILRTFGGSTVYKGIRPIQR